ncbi:uncharacterized protein LOC129730274 isoform X2 [Wyeomyia smithii]|uniref:uncharacterized protein LOC129730274 isoform X2 n=1 Tax=Wyeomyia smithii TaxID=174621 RepID=UPI002467C418|nr:uncharacterized protein LOC129730274 isoform X2 [Wyeomyia smithii]
MDIPVIDMFTEEEYLESSVGISVGEPELSVAELYSHEPMEDCIAGPSHTRTKPSAKFNLQKKTNELKELQRTVLQEQLNLIHAQDQLLKQQQELSIEQRNEKHTEEMKLMKLKQEIAMLKLKILKIDND